MNKVLRVLNVEDSPPDSDLLSRHLKAEGYELTLERVDTSMEMLKALAENEWDIVLCDYMMPRFNALLALEVLRGTGLDLPFIIISGTVGEEVAVQAMLTGANDYIYKDNLTRLVPAIERELNEARNRKLLRRAEDAQRLIEDRYRALFEHAPDGIVIADSKSFYLDANASMCRMLGYTRDELIGLYATVIVTEDASVQVDSALKTIKPKSDYKQEWGFRRKDGSVFTGEVIATRMPDGNILAVIRDITERKCLEDQLTHQALHDPLTKLANRVLFRDRVEHALARAERKNSYVAVLFLDLDNFKNVNDSFGHAAGDELLVSVTERLKACLRLSDTPARLGGDEFAVLVEDIVDGEGAVLVAERIRSVLALPFSITGKEIFVGTSIGIAMAGAKETPEELLRNADVAMYMSKSSGKNRYTVFESEMRDAITERLRLETDMRRAIDRGEFEIFYQPIMDLRSEKMMGMEALVRWNHPESGLIAPLDFIPVAEDTGLIVPLGKWILEEACLQASEWQAQYGDRGRLSISVNIASRQFQEDGLLEMVAAALDKSGLPPQSLILEITESTMLINTEASILKLKALKGLGIRLAIDDFGTGYSSLSYLQRFPIDILKIDKSFIDKIVDGKEGAAVAKAIITMSDTLQLKTIAEGVESLGQSTELQNLGCELGQGFYFSKPLPVNEMNNFICLSTFVVDQNWPQPLRLPISLPVETPAIPE